MNAELQVGCFFAYGESGILDARDRLADLRQEYALVELAMDNWNRVQLGAELTREGVRVVDLPQKDVRMSPASDRLRTAITEQRLVLPNDPALTLHAANAVMRLNRRGWRIERPDRASPVDGMISLAMAVERVETQPQAVRLNGWI
jgi:phage terminase large subunit-like protein